MITYCNALHIRIPILISLLSYLFPVRLRRLDEGNEHLELYLANNRLQLGTRDTLYSDGDKYLPAVTAAKHLKPFLPSVKKVLVLGTGLGSIVQVLRKYRIHPHYTLVENNKSVLKCAMEFLGRDKMFSARPVCLDAGTFIEKNTDKFDLIFLDVFIGRVVPDFITTQQFFSLCRHSLAPGGRLAFNYMVSDEAEWQRVLEQFNAVFPVNEIVTYKLNRIFITG